MNVEILELWSEINSVPVVVSDIISCNLFHEVIFSRDSVDKGIKSGNR